MNRPAFYAQIDENGICVSVAQLSGEIESPELVPIQFFDLSLLGKRWNGEEWEELGAGE